MAVKIIKVDYDKNYPRGYKYKFQTLYFKNNEWKRLIRIDNSLHFGKPQQHMHIGNKIKKTNIKPEDIEGYLLRLTEKLLKEDKNGKNTNS